VLETKSLSNGKRLIKCRNPWGTEKYNGPYSDKSELWDEESKKEVGFEDNNEGIFYTDIETYIKCFSETWVSYNVENWSSAKFLKLDDHSLKPKTATDYNKENEGIWKGICGPGCTRHELKIKSDVAQTVHLTAWTWDDRGVPDKCEPANDGNIYHSMYIENKFPGDIFAWRYGDYSMEPF